MSYIDMKKIVGCRIDNDVVSKIYIDRDIVYQKSGPGPTPGGLLTFTAIEASMVYLQNHGSNEPNCEYSFDGTTWRTMPTSSYSAISIAAGSSIQIRGNNPNGFSTSSSNNSRFTFMDGKISASGNITSLIDQVGETKVIPSEYCYYRLFYNRPLLTTAPELPATTLTLRCYSEMFYGCTSLTTAPELPATTLNEDYCYAAMFSGCTSLKVNQNGSGTKIFTCPRLSGYRPTYDMFSNTGGTFKGTPTTGNTYNWYT